MARCKCLAALWWVSSSILNPYSVIQRRCWLVRTRRLVAKSDSASALVMGGSLWYVLIVEGEGWGCLPLCCNPLHEVGFDLLAGDGDGLLEA